jgi:pullulanase
MKNITLILVAMTILAACNQNPPQYSSFDTYPTPVEENLWLGYSKESTTFKLWSPVAIAVKVNLYDKGKGGKASKEYALKHGEHGIWQLKVKGDLKGKYYTYQIKQNKEWLAETPGIYAQAVGVNGKRAMVVDMQETNPEGWKQDKGPKINHPNEAILYEMHIRDMTINPNAGNAMPGKYLGLVEEGTKTKEGIATGFDHIKEMGITHVHLLPTFDHYSIEESRLDSAQFNWGYDPQHYNVPEGSFSSDPFNAEVRIREFKKMVKAFHDAGIGVVLDVVYNHTGRTGVSPFDLEVPGYYYRFNEDSTYSNASGCGNETASERAMVRKYMMESVAYWAKEYHLDGFRFDLMGIHDIETMNQIAGSLKEINPNIFVYGEGWTAGGSPLPEEQRALKKHTWQMPQIAAFSDDIRDGLKGSVFDELSTGFASGAEGMEASVQFGVVGSIFHPQINYKVVNYSDTNWAKEPWQAVSYVSCHDNHTLFDKLKISKPKATDAEIIAMHKLANAVVLTSQGIPFLHAGVEMMRTKGGEHNSYNLPDAVNQIDWQWKKENAGVVEYYKNLIKLRKEHPLFYLPSAAMVNQNLHFDKAENGLVAFAITNANGLDSWGGIMVIYNANTRNISFEVDGKWNVAVRGDKFYLDNSVPVSGKVQVPAISMMVLYRE